MPDLQPLETIPMSYDQYALIVAQQRRDQQIAHATEHRLAMHGRMSAARTGRRSVLRPVGLVLVRLGHALGGEPEPSTLQPARSR